MAEGTGSTRSALIVYGSETGNAQEVAEELGRIAERLHFVTHVKECNDVEAVSVISLFYSQKSIDRVLDYSGLAFTCHLCRINYWPRRFPTQCPWILEDAFAEKTPRDFSQRRQIYAVWAR